MSVSFLVQSQLLATKFFVPTVAGTIISRPRLTSLLDESLEYPLTIVSAPAGFGKTMLLSAWAQAQDPYIAWLSLDEEDNEPRLFWTYALSALDQQQERLAFLSQYLQSPQIPAIQHVLTLLCQMIQDSPEHMVLILDDYHLITEQEIHSSLLYLIEHSPPNFHIILSTRIDPPLPLTLLRMRGQVLEVHADQLRMTEEETEAFFREAMGMLLSDETIALVTARTEGWLVGLQLLALGLAECHDPAVLLSEIRGDQRYILDYLTEEVLRRQPEDIQTFLLSTCILERLTAPLCDAVMQQPGSQSILQQLEETNLFVVALDGNRSWYRYHALFAEALRHQLEQMHSDLISLLHYRASIWYAQNNSRTAAILHAFHAHKWEWAADLIERIPEIMALTWGIGENELILLRKWLEQLPMPILHSRPRLCLASAQCMWLMMPPPVLLRWLAVAEATLNKNDISALTAEERQEHDNLLGEVISFQALLRSYAEDGEIALALCHQAESLLRPENLVVRTFVAAARCWALYTSSLNDATSAVQVVLNGIAHVQDQAPMLAIAGASSAALHMIGTGQLRKAQQLIGQTMKMETYATAPLPPEMGWPAVFQADLLREWNDLATARVLAEKAIERCKENVSTIALFFLLCGHAVLLRIYLSCRDLDAAEEAMEDFEKIGQRIEPSFDRYVRSHFITIDQVRLWLATQDHQRAILWAEMLDMEKQYGTPYAHERQEVAHARILLATHQPTQALQRLNPALQRATAGQRWNHVIEIQLLQALAHQMNQNSAQAISILSDAIRLAEPEGYIRRFVDEGPPMKDLLSQLQPTAEFAPYLNKLLASFEEQPSHKRTCWL